VPAEHHRVAATGGLADRSHLPGITSQEVEPMMRVQENLTDIATCMLAANGWLPDFELP